MPDGAGTFSGESNNLVCQGLDLSTDAFNLYWFMYDDDYYSPIGDYWSPIDPNGMIGGST